MNAEESRTKQASRTGIILLTLGAGQFVMTLDSSVMNVSIATVAKDVGTTIAGIQTAITLYTLVMAMLMITGGKIGSIIGRRRAFALGCVIYAAGSLTTALSPSLPVLILGWSVLEGIGAALILPAIVALVAGNFPPEGRSRAYGLVMAAGAIAIAVGPLIGGLATTYFSWRWVFVGEVVIIVPILLESRRIQDAEPEQQPRLDVIGGGPVRGGPRIRRLPAHVPTVAPNAPAARAFGRPAAPRGDDRPGVSGIRGERAGRRPRALAVGRRPVPPPDPSAPRSAP